MKYTKRVRSTQTGLAAKLVALRRTKVVDLDDDTLGPSECCVTIIRIRLCGQLVAKTTTWARTSAGANTEEVLRCGGVEAWVAVPSASCGGGVAVARAEGVASTVSEFSGQ